MSSVATGEVEAVDGVLVIRRIHVAYELQAPADHDEAAVERAHALHADRCPVYRSLHPQIAISTELKTVGNA